ncbi:GNAT family N-acetyltransferase [Guptibacillus algicola]|uniref:GNAT family N-acetyltransferase n=1 Tax=Guptibacillus algicola TaxID=225844 RepID=UPI001CD77A87|nr:GNAT family N-acetyltransferase [Alkalihalobacillus algicola]MCA0986717.1 GNAT family N-acetyltransferase [Alkalihalobacillus algicola]
MNYILEKIAALQWDYEPSFVPECIHFVQKEDLIMIKNLRSTSVHANRVVRYNKPVENIEMVFDYFEGRPFSWWVIENKELESKLSEHGMTHHDTYIGLARTLEDVNVTPERYRIENVTTKEDVCLHAKLSAEIWGYDEKNLEAAINERESYLNLPDRRGGFVLAFDEDTPVGYSSYRYSHDGDALYMTGAGVLQSHRGKGVYRKMVENRLVDAKEKGSSIAVTQARYGTSEPILRKLGFQEHGVFKQYIPDEKA